MLWLLSRGEAVEQMGYKGPDSVVLAFGDVERGSGACTRLKLSRARWRIRGPDLALGPR